MGCERIAWAAGLFEGEGCSSIYGGWKGRRYPALCLGSTDEDVLRRFARIVKGGNVTGPYRYGKNVKPMWSWRAAARADVQRIGRLLRPYLGARRRARLREVLAT